MRERKGGGRGGRERKKERREGRKGERGEGGGRKGERGEGGGRESQRGVGGIREGNRGSKELERAEKDKEGCGRWLCVGDGVENYTYICTHVMLYPVECLLLRFMEPWAIILLGGVLPFGSIFIEV